MIVEHDIGVLTESLPKFGLRVGDSGVVVAVLGEGAAYLVEFFTAEGETIDVVYVEGDQLRPRTAEDLRPVKKADAKPARLLSAHKRYASTPSSTASATK
ncbi:MAG: DUF4926 domain-containing protein [Anaerolineaceae bacterium]|nr:DUF4926 domain-containing protein [Anaerolineaceae bacterium]